VTAPARLLERVGLRSRWAFVSVATLVYWIGPQSVRLYYPLELHAQGASDLVIGLAVAASSAAGLVLAVPSGYLLDRFNSQNVLVLSSVGLAGTTGLFALSGSVATMIVLMFCQGVFQTWVWLVLQEMITRVDDGPAGRRQLSLFSVTWGIGLAAGPSIWAAWYAAFGFRSLTVTCFVFTLLATVSAFGVPAALRRVGSHTHGVTTADDTGPGVGEPKGMMAALRRSMSNPAVVSVMSASFVNIFVQSLRLSFYPLFLERQGVPLATIGLLLSVIGGSSLAVRLVLPFGIKRFGQISMLIWSTWIAIVGVAMTPLSDNLGFLLAGAAMIGSGLGANPPITVNLLAGREGTDKGVAVGLRMVANRSAQVVQPVLFGGMAALIGLAAAFPIAGVLLGGLTVWLSRQMAPLKGTT
jgi:MFS family permease